jgi:hypothetical protein
MYKVLLLMQIGDLWQVSNRRLAGVLQVVHDETQGGMNCVLDILIAWETAWRLLIQCSLTRLSASATSSQNVSHFVSVL